MVRSSRQDSSGWACRSRRISTSSSSCSATTASISVPTGVGATSYIESRLVHGLTRVRAPFDQRDPHVEHEGGRPPSAAGRELQDLARGRGAAVVREVGLGDVDAAVRDLDVTGEGHLGEHLGRAPDLLRHHQAREEQRDVGRAVGLDRDADRGHQATGHLGDLAAPA